VNNLFTLKKKNHQIASEYPPFVQPDSITLAYSHCFRQLFTMANIPDPTADLDWTYDGSIIEHFARNAEAHPERTCVVETKTSDAPERRFTYKQIYEASNILAHHLTEAGVTNGDVVMIWAHRSVDLVVAIMGTLVSPYLDGIVEAITNPKKSPPVLHSQFLTLFTLLADNRSILKLLNLVL
jgi:hypothetical protein